MLDPEVARALEHVARDLGRSRDVEEILNAIVTSARDSLPEIDHAGISVTHRDGTIATQAWTDELVTVLDDLQYELGEGPCLSAMDPTDGADTVHVDNIRHDQRWPRFVPRAVEHGLRSQLGLRLYVESETVGGLNLYSTSSDTISDDTQVLAHLFATHAALALGRVRTETGLSSALASRELIGQATGIIMERYGLNRERAFDYLVRVSSHSNTKLRFIAAQLVNQTNRS